MNWKWPGNSIRCSAVRRQTWYRSALVLLGVDVVMDATLQLVRKDGDPLLEILGIKPVEQ